MSRNVFTPNLQTAEPAAPTPPADRPDTMSAVLLSVARTVVTGLALVLPIFFLPGLWATLGFQKSLLALCGVVVVLIVLSLTMLRHARVYSVIPMPLLVFFGFVGVAAISGVLSADPGMAFRGSVLEVQTVAFFGILGGVMALPLVLQQSKRYTMRVLQSFIIGALLLLLYVVLRFFAGPILAMGSFFGPTASPLGGFNDLAIFSGLCIIISVVTLLQLPLRVAYQACLAVVSVLSLIVLMVVNFFFVWIVIGFFGLLVLLYMVSRDRLFTLETSSESQPPGRILVGVTVLICLCSAWFIVMGDFASTQVNRLVAIDYLEVRPSFSATVDIAQSALRDNALFGTGPNQFVTSWRLYKDPAINQTLFWNTDFVAGSGYVPTLFITTGLLGGLALIAFHAWYLWHGFRMLLRSRSTDQFWYFVGVVSFVGAAFLWGMTYIYVPGTTLLLLAALFTGVSFAASAALLPETVRAIQLATSQQRGFVLMAVAIICISSSVGVLFTVGKQYVAHASFAAARAQAADVAVVDQAAAVAYSQYPDHQFLSVRAQIALLEMNQLLAVQEPGEAEQQQFLAAAERAVYLSGAAIEAAPENPSYYAILSGVYNNLATAGVTGALERATSSLVTAQQLDPHNPTYALIEAQMAARRGDAAGARAAVRAALEKKRNFTEALFLATQIDIAEGNTDAAIETTRAIITLEPNNPTRYYQLGILLTAAERLAEAQVAYDRALALDPNYANARYLRALLSAQAGDTETAVAELELLTESNPDNAELEAVIAQLRSGQPIAPVIDSVAPPVSEVEPVVDAETVTSTVAPDSDLLTPLNTAPGSGDTESEPTNESDDTVAPATSDTATATDSLDSAAASSTQ